MKLVVYLKLLTLSFSVIVSCKGYSLTIVKCFYLALGSQAINYYRYGSKRDCAGKWEDFKFCMKTKTKSSELADVRMTLCAKKKKI